MMEESDQMLDFDAVWSEALYLQTECSDHDCPPPLFDLPPPPPPPWSSSSESEECSEEFDQCENIVIIDSGVNLEQTFQNLIIIAVSSAILVILIVFIVACIWRWRHKSTGHCDCGPKVGDSGHHHSDHGHMELSSGQNIVSGYNEVYDNPNYSHIMIGGQPFFILPTGELSEHVPVPQQHLSVTPRKITVDTQLSGTLPPNNHIYEGGSSTYRSTSDYDTDSSTYRPDSNPGQQPIYEEIDREADMRLRHVSPVNTMAVINTMNSVQTRLERPQHPWSPGAKSLSPRRPNNSRVNNSNNSNNSSIYYYSDTLRCKRVEMTESDSGISSESTPQHVTRTRDTRDHCPPAESSPVQTKVFLTNLTARERHNVVKL